METSISEAPVAAPANAQPAYPTIAESWGVLGWYLLIGLLAGAPLLLLSNNVLALPRPIASVVLTVALNTGLLWLLRRRAGRRWQPLQFTGQEILWLYAVLPLFVLAAAFVLSTVYFLHLPNWMEKYFDEMSRNPLLAIGFVGIVGPVLEEILFRGVILQGLLRNYPQRPWVAIGQSALVFGIIHFNPVQTVYAGLLGLLLGWLYYRTRSLWLCMAVHALNNLLAVHSARQTVLQKMSSPLEAFASPWQYAAAVLLSALVLAGLLWRVHQVTAPPIAAEEA